MLALDTHIVVFLLAGQLTKRERAALETDPEWSISAIVLWELSLLVAKRRIVLDLNAADTREALAAFYVYPITLAVAQQSCALDIQSDPADHLIAATSVVHRAPLVTRDKKIRRSKLVPFATAPARCPP